MLPAQSWDMIRARQRRATIHGENTIAGKMRRFDEYADFLNTFVRQLNQMADEGWAVLVEGKRDAAAVRGLGYTGRLATVSSVSRLGARAVAPAKRVVILTDLDREGRILAARFIKLLSHEGIRTSLSERRRLRVASRGAFRHIENLSRFSETEV
jgi:5S rRNA maturation endonuclease (ribonuclease M5)